MISLRPGQDYRSKSPQRLQDDIVRYYDECYWDYRTSWLNGENLAIHYGYWDERTRNHSDSLLNLNRVLAETARIRSGERVLDAGCGIGGSSIWLARHHQARVTGITLSQPQVIQARNNAERHGVDARVDFQQADFCAAPFADASFDVIWGIESICHALDKRAFVREAYRLLRGGGRLVCSDGYAKRRLFTEAEWRLVRTCLDGWEIPNLATPEEFSADLATSGFQDIRFAEVTANILPSARRLRRIALFTYPMQQIMVWLRLRTPAQSGNFYTALNQYRIFSEGLACYGVFCAVK